MPKSSVVPSMKGRSGMSLEAIDAMTEFADGLYELQRMCGGTVPKHPSYGPDHGVRHEAVTVDVEYDRDNPEPVVQEIKSRLDPSDGSAWADTYNTALSIMESRFESVTEGIMTEGIMESERGIRTLSLLARQITADVPIRNDDESISLRVRFPIAGPIEVSSTRFSGRLCDFDYGATRERLQLLRMAALMEAYDVSPRSLIDYFGSAAGFTDAVRADDGTDAWASLTHREAKAVTESQDAVEQAVPAPDRPSVRGDAERDSSEIPRILFGENPPEIDEDMSVRDEDEVSTAELRALIEHGHVDAGDCLWDREDTVTYGGLLRFMERIDALGGSTVYLNGKVHRFMNQVLPFEMEEDHEPGEPLPVEEKFVFDVNAFGVVSTDGSSLSREVLSLVEEFNADNYTFEPESRSPSRVGFWWD